MRNTAVYLRAHAAVVSTLKELTRVPEQKLFLLLTHLKITFGKDRMQTIRFF